ncbi:S26 family signal peptidase [Microbacterium sp. SZ1]|uniref:signal peptidase I n=1 Tax=Microbacterium sp. SZ1 TaxID=1849736 RepID=UPI000BBC2EBA|nr:signal peptidase I [Microbacterium sp. SZ1]PCE14613.1 S26 family signal peptidase [Microbacterium sp. SZ1]
MSTPITRRELREHVAESSADAPSARKRRVGRLLVDSALWIAAAAGVVCIALVVLAFAAQVTLIMFRTGSMSPTIPAGSVAVVQQVPASQVGVGDVVTVDRPGELPITHRITSVADGVTEDERVITMRGDANASDDPFPYAVTSVRRVLFSVPGVASVIVALSDPLVLGGITVAATVLVVWAFWPRKRREEGRG